MTPAASVRWRGRLVRSFPWHARGFVALNLLLTAANVVGGRPWWALWPLFATGFLLALHFFLYKAFTVDEEWADQRVTELNLKSYDRGHIEDIKARQGQPAHGRGLKPD